MIDFYFRVKYCVTFGNEKSCANAGKVGIQMLILWSQEFLTKGVIFVYILQSFRTVGEKPMCQ